MLKDRILSTLRFFDLQGYPLTLLELHKFLLADIQILKSRINTDWELIEKNNNDNNNDNVSIDKVLKCIDEECQNEIEQKSGFYCLKGRGGIIHQRLANYIYGIKRERRIRRFVGGLKHMPFVRGVALGGSQALGLQKPTSDVDLLLFIEYGYLWLVRPLLVAYFQILGIRRHGRFVSDRICLNHYLTDNREVKNGKDLYNAMEYLRLRPLVYPQTVGEFCLNNQPWLKFFFPNFKVQPGFIQPISRLQGILERCLKNKFFGSLSEFLKKWQLKRARRGNYVVVSNNELSFHSLQRKRLLLANFFGNP
jgi:hypothetical protein